MNADLLDPDAVSKGDALGIMARKIGEGYRVGEHRSPFHGFAIALGTHLHVRQHRKPFVAIAITSVAIAVVAR